MKILYIDVYFLINFTVDLLSLYFASIFSHVKSTVFRILAASAVGAGFASAVVLINLHWFIYVVLLIMTAFIVCFVFAPELSFLRGIKLFFSFFIFETFIGGFVSLVYSRLDERLYPLIEETDVVSRRTLILALAILLAWGLIKLFFLIFDGRRGERNVNLRLELMGMKQEVRALVDSGNLLKDPIGNTPIIIMKRERFKLYGDIKDFTNTNDTEIKKRIRFIPTNSLGGKKLLIGLRLDYLTVIDNGKAIKNATVAFDEEKGTFGGYYALAPDSLIGE